jgi:DNA-binding NarL/FixJ family response regulator
VAASAAVRLVVVDEQRTLAEALAARLDVEDDLAVEAAVCSVEALSVVLAAGRVDVLLLGTRDDSTVGGTPCPVVLHELARRSPGLRVVVMAACSDAAVVAQALHSGMAGWVPKEAGIGLLLDTVRGVSRDETWIPANLLTQVLEALGSREDRDNPLARLASLTPRERDVLRGIVDGLSRSDIAARLSLSPNTVRTHVQHVLRKLDVHSALTAAAVARGLVADPPGSRPGARLASSDRFAPGWSDAS